MPEGDTLVGQRIGNYQILRSLGVGGMGVVYLGEHPEIQSRVAIKVLLPRFVENEQVTRRFLDEARAVNRVGHAGIVRIHDCGRQEGVGVYLIMELLEGKTFQEHLDVEGTFSEERVARLLRQTASALAASHQAGIIHRDLKPSNLFLVPDLDLLGGERVKILDFGIAKLLQRRDSKKDHTTESGMVMGSLLFMSPEQCLDTKRVDGRTDIYSLGAIGYYLLSGEFPFEAESLGQLVLKHQQSQAEPLRRRRPAVSERTAAIIHRALAVDADQRFASMADLRDALGDLLGIATGNPPGSAAGAVTVKDRPRASTTFSGTAGELVALQAASGRRRLIFAVTLGLLLLTGGFVAWQKSGRSDGPHPRPGISTTAGGSAGATHLVSPGDQNAPAKPDLRAPDRRAPDAASARVSQPGVPRPAPISKARPPGPRPVSSPPEPPPTAQPKGPQDAPSNEDKKKKAFFDDDL